MRVNSKAMSLLDNFLKRPTEKKLREFLDCCGNCLYGMCFGGYTPGPCPKLCHQLSEERLEAFGSYLCAAVHAARRNYLRIWRERPAELVVHLMRFNAYIKSISGEINAS
jgi:hypothetical protein